MATYYGLRCLSCARADPSEEKYPTDATISECWARRMWEYVIDAVADAPLVKNLVENQKSDLEYPQVLGNPIPWDWILRHYGHELVIHDEYGRDHPELTLPAWPQAE